MEINTESKNRKLYLVALTVFLLFVGLIVYFLFFRTPPQNLGTEKSSEPSEEIINSADAEAKKEFLDDQKDNEDQSSNTPTPPAESDITLSAEQEDSGNVTVFTKLQSIPNGTCSLTVSNGSKQTTQTAEIIYQPEYSSCAGFTVQKTELGVGEWEINLQVTHGSEKYNKDLTINVK